MTPEVLLQALNDEVTRHEGETGELPRWIYLLPKDAAAIDRFLGTNVLASGLFGAQVKITSYPRQLAYLESLEWRAEQLPFDRTIRLFGRPPEGTGYEGIGTSVTFDPMLARSQEAAVEAVSERLYDNLIRATAPVRGVFRHRGDFAPYKIMQLFPSPRARAEWVSEWFRTAPTLLLNPQLIQNIQVALADTGALNHLTPGVRATLDGLL